MEDYQKTIEKLTIQLNNEKGHTAYWQGMAGTYRIENHKNLKKLQKLSFFLKLLIVTVVILAVALLVVIYG